MVGFLISGFVLQAFGQKEGEGLDPIAELGVTLMLFTRENSFRLYSEAGSGFAEHVFTVFSQQRPDLAQVWRRKKSDNDETKITWPRSPKAGSEEQG
ncbi:MAG: hypothetical protein IZT59_00500 [Verrucomicrobia bacterium]|nr:hypothetical protein [Verrucomicrobiota bacterium]